LVQLFFKQNRYFKNNAAYGPWNHKDPESESSREGSTPQSMAASMPFLIKAPGTLHENARGQSMMPFIFTKSISNADLFSRTAENIPSPNPSFIDLSGSFGSSPTLPWDHTLPASKDIYDIPDEQVRFRHKLLVLQKLTINRNHRLHVGFKPYLLSSLKTDSNRTDGG